MESDPGRQPPMRDGADPPVEAPSQRSFAGLNVQVRDCTLKDACVEGECDRCHMSQLASLGSSLPLATLPSAYFPCGSTPSQRFGCTWFAGLSECSAISPFLISLPSEHRQLGLPPVWRCLPLVAVAVLAGLPYQYRYPPAPHPNPFLFIFLLQTSKDFQAISLQ